jgi:hypothetical protein
LTFNQYKQKHRASNKGMEIATFLPIAAGQFYLLSCWLKAGIWAFTCGFPMPF